MPEIASGVFPDFETKRLAVAHWAPVLADGRARARLEAVLAKGLTAPVLAPLPPPLQLSGPEEVADWIDARAAESDVFLITARADPAAVLGLMILADMADGDARVLHLGYLLWEMAWGQGYATELVIGLVETAAEVGGLELHAGVAQDNPASVRVLEKAGLQRADGSAPDGMLLYLRRF